MKFSEIPDHHAVLLVHGDRRELAESLFREISASSPAHKFFNQTVLDIETARKIISWSQTPYGGEKIGIISFHTIGHEAQNALLKVLEEPKEGARFILVTSNKDGLIDTVTSRLYHVQVPSGNEVDTLAELFLKTKYTSRMKLPQIVELLARVDEEDRKDKESTRTFILFISRVLENHKMNQKYILKTVDVASYAALPSASGKALLEYLALLLPSPLV